MKPYVIMHNLLYIFFFFLALNFMMYYMILFLAYLKKKMIQRY